MEHTLRNIKQKYWKSNIYIYIYIYNIYSCLHMCVRVCVCMIKNKYNSDKKENTETWIEG